MMLGVLLSVLTLPTPSPTPLKTITNIRVSPLCTALHENVGRAVKDLIENNGAVDDSKSLFMKMARDKVSSFDRNMVMDMNVQRIGPLIGMMAANIQKAEAELRDISLRSASNADRQRLSEMKKQLEAIIAHQNEELNVLSGVYFSYNGNRLLGHGDGLPKGDGTGVPVDDPNKETAIVLPPIKSADASPTPTPAPSADSNSSTLMASRLAPDPTTSPASSSAVREVDLGLAAQTKFAQIFNQLTTYQIGEQTLEAQAAKTIMEAANECKSH